MSATKAEINYLARCLEECVNYLDKGANSNAAELKEHINDLKGQLKDINTVGVATLTSTTVNGMALGITNAVKGFQAGDPVAGTAGLMTTFASLAPIASFVAPPIGIWVGGILSAIFGIANTILG